jgi:hypothetical protein
MLTPKEYDALMPLVRGLLTRSVELERLICEIKHGDTPVTAEASSKAHGARYAAYDDLQAWIRTHTDWSSTD